MKKLFLLFIFSFFLSPNFAQGVAISTNGDSADPSAILDIESTNSGLLLPRMTTAQRDLIVNPAHSLIIFNTTIDCFEAFNSDTEEWIAIGCIGYTVPSGVSASATPNPICKGSTLILTGEATDATSWSWTGPNDYTSSSQSPSISNITIAGQGIYTLVVSNDYGSVTANTTYVTVKSPPTNPTLGTHVSDEEQIEWNWTSVTNANGYKYNTSNNYSTAINNGNNTSYTQIGLTCETAYTLYVWAYNECGESSSTTLNETTSDCPSACDGIPKPTDYDGNIYEIVGIGNQCWFAENMATTHYADGTVIPHVTNNSDWVNLSVSDKAYCWYNNDITNKNIYGALYTWAAAANNTTSSSNPSGVQGICPNGWHLPSDDEWEKLEGEVDATYPYGDAQWDISGYRGDDVGSALAGNESLWNNGVLVTHPSFGNSGFLALPAGYRKWSDGAFSDLGSHVGFWSTTSASSSNVYPRQFSMYYTKSSRITTMREFGMSVRCIKD
ncbi:MAG: hypothetical protein GX793_10130 [Bacteroidales bacterium]|jgi:uncharacterized protein (TIGR02145 family)|nr:hypothetical protein [Bacteroidales bacterium]MCK9499763.1 hypothetical protein [Bacteroidales bacterium]NLB87404.1 hypothetical protein [Bacteroidales bacterium]